MQHHSDNAPNVPRKLTLLVVRDTKGTKSATKGFLAEEDHAVEALGLHRQDPALSDGVPVRRLLAMRTVRERISFMRPGLPAREHGGHSKSGQAMTAGLERPDDRPR